MNLIFEGPDNSGKTTLANHLVDKAKVNYFHAGGPPKDWLAECECLNHQAKIFTINSPLVADRVTCISQQVYSTMQDPLEKSIRGWAVARLLDYGVVVIYCRPYIDKLMRTDQYTWREDETEEHKQRILSNHLIYIEKYDQVMSKIPCIHVNYEDSSYPFILEQLITALKGDIEAQKWVRNLQIKGSL